MSALAWALLIAGGLCALGLAVAFGEGVSRKFQARRETADPADVRAARALLDRTDEQAALDAAYEQASAVAELGLGWEMPSREQIEAAASDGGHDRLPMSERDRALEVALLEGEFHAVSRPPVGSERTDPDGTAHRW